MTTEIQLKRLGILVEELEKLRDSVPASEVCFDMGQWCELQNAESRTTRTKILADIEAATLNPCNTYACLAGKAGLIPRIRRAGFKWTISDPKAGEDDDSCWSHTEFQYKDRAGHVVKGHDAITAFYGESAMSNVFLHHSHGIDTLQDGIELLTTFIKWEKSEDPAKPAESRPV